MMGFALLISPLNTSRILPRDSRGSIREVFKFSLKVILNFAKQICSADIYLLLQRYSSLHTKHR